VFISVSLIATQSLLSWFSRSWTRTRLMTTQWARWCFL